MTHPKVSLRPVTREDVKRIRQWLENEEVAESWYGRYSYGNPAHLGYHPEEAERASDEEFHRIFDDPEHRILSVYAGEEHIGEVHIAVEASLGDGQFSILIGRPEFWHHGYGTEATKQALGMAFNEVGLYRVWVDIPEYNEAARALFTHLGFTHEGTLRKSRPHEGSRFDSVVMGMLAAEYNQRAREDRAEKQSV
ncbi:MAG: GNAT family N-acetyltransferase [Chloroflexi bacterium]|nr:GNAT family N-acetyltransferase [Chloroflexota bacterium]